MLLLLLMLLTRIRRGMRAMMKVLLVLMRLLSIWGLCEQTCPRKEYYYNTDVIFLPLPLFSLHYTLSNQQTTPPAPHVLQMFNLDTKALGNHMSAELMVDDFNIRSSGQRGDTLESLREQ